MYLKSISNIPEVLRELKKSGVLLNGTTETIAHKVK